MVYVLKFILFQIISNCSWNIDVNKTLLLSTIKCYSNNLKEICDYHGLNRAQKNIDNLHRTTIFYFTGLY